MIKDSGKYAVGVSAFKKSFIKNVDFELKDKRNILEDIRIWNWEIRENVKEDATEKNMKTLIKISSESASFCKFFINLQ